MNKPDQGRTMLLHKSFYQPRLIPACVAALFYLPIESVMAVTPAVAAQCEVQLMYLAAMQGEVSIQFGGSSERPVQPGEGLCAGAVLKVAAGARAVLRLRDGSAIPLDQNTRIRLLGLATDGRTVQLELLYGNINVSTTSDLPIRVVTPHGKVQTQGGDFAVNVSEKQSALSVFQGQVDASNDAGSLLLQSDETAFFAPLAAPKRDITIKPRDLVQWVVQYPAVIQLRETRDKALEPAIQAYAQGRIVEALIHLDQVPEAARSAEYHVYRANVLLSGGQSDEARKSLEATLQQNPGNPDAWALFSVLELGRNQPEQSLAYARKAIEQGAQSAAAHLAYSYALQANRQPEEALVHARHAVELAPKRAITYVRLAELELARGMRQAALQAAQQAEVLEPKLIETKSLLGFIYLSQDAVSKAQTSFESALQLNATDARARMGLGLTRIRQGELQKGREELELAASLDPDNPLIRTYLGRAYDEEGHSNKAAEQYAYAKRVDPQDPTPYAFNAIRLANQNQEVSALAEMQEALVRNDNRAVYRDQSLLDEDQARRQANAIALELSLGLDEAARLEGSQGVSRNPQSGILHQAYGDALLGLPRTDAARRSEYLQAQIYAPIGTPAPPLFLSENIQRSGFEAAQHGFFRAVDPGQVGFNEYTGVFKSGPWQAQAEGTLGGKNTKGGQVQVSGAVGPVGWSFSQLHFKTDGFGRFNRLDNSVLRGIVQADVTSTTRLMLEAQQFSSDRQDILFPAEPFFFSPLRVSDDRQRYRVALRHGFAERHELIVLGNWENARQITDFLPTDFIGADTSRFALKSHGPEYQYRLKLPNFNAVLGQRYHKTVATNLVSNISEVRSQVSYLYTALQLPYRLDVDLGVSLDKADSTNGLQQQQTSRKLGLRWQPIAGGQLRIASMEGVVDGFLNNATLEPSQLAGFHQAFNDIFGSKYHRRAIAWDQQWRGGLSGGVEASARDLQVPVGNVFVPWDERQNRVHLTWALPRQTLDKWLPGSEAALTLGHDHLHLTRHPDFTGSEEFTDYRARQLRLGVNWKHQSGWSGNLVLSHVRSQALFNVFAEDFSILQVPSQDRFWITDLALSYRLPGKLGQISLGALNLFNRRGFQHLELDTQNPRYAPERLVYGKLQIGF